MKRAPPIAQDTDAEPATPADPASPAPAALPYFYFDIHGHREGTLPGAMRLVPGNTIPPDVSLSEVPATGTAGFVVCALGDPNSFIPVKVDPYRDVLRQLAAARKSALEAGGIIAAGADALCDAAARRKPAFVLGIEGGDFLATDAGRLDEVHRGGVRLLGLVHYSRNAIGSISFGWGGRIVPQSERTGLSDFGKAVVARANALGIMVDLAHADEETIRGALAVSAAPMVCSHTGPRALQEFPRYLRDDLMREIAGAGGLIGLWPFFSGGAGVPDLETFGAYAAHCAGLVGAERLAIGSDINGVPGNMAGYVNLFDAPAIVGALENKGFSPDEIAGIAGHNFINFFRRVAEAASSVPG